MNKNKDFIRLSAQKLKNLVVFKTKTNEPFKEKLSIKDRLKTATKLYPGTELGRRIIIIGTSGVIVGVLPIKIYGKIVLFLLNFMGFELYFQMENNPQQFKKTLISTFIIAFCSGPFFQIASMATSRSSGSTLIHSNRITYAQIDPSKKENPFKGAIKYIVKLGAASALLGRSLFRLNSMDFDTASPLEVSSAVGEFFISSYLFVSHLTDSADHQIFQINNIVLFGLTGLTVGLDFMGPDKPNIMQEVNEKLFKPVVENETLAKSTTDLDVPYRYSIKSYNNYDIEDLLYPTNRLNIAKDTEKQRNWINYMMETAEVYQQAEKMNSLDSTTSASQTYKYPETEMSLWLKRMIEENERKKNDN